MKKEHKYIFLLFSLFFFPFFENTAQQVTLKKENLSLPTYEIGKADINPIFYTGRSYQGAQGHIYPYPMFDMLTDNKIDKSYEALYLENEFINICVLPEMGGRIFSATDKTNSYDFFYRQTGIKPALIGMLGAWLSGGVEWNFPHHHRPSSYMDVDYTLTENADGSKTIWIGETELRHRFKWSVGVTVHPNRSYVETKVRIMNRTPYIQSMLYWANVSVHCGPDYEVIFPPHTQFGTDHSKVAFTEWQKGEAVRNSGNIVDLALWKNYTGDPRSIFAWNFEDDFLAGYDHNKKAGTVHVANRHIVNGKKFFLWGNNSSAQMWDKMLSDKDGHYLELMVGAYSDNQPDYSWISPGEIREFSHFWYPIKDIQDVKNANYDAAVNLERINNEKVFIGYNTTTKYKNARVILKSGNNTLFDATTDIDPSTPFTKQVSIPNTVNTDSLYTALYDASGNKLIDYKPVVLEQQQIPEAVKPVKNPKEFTTVEELYLAGLRLEQFHNARLNPMDYYNEALKRDSGDSRVNTVIGIRYAKEGNWSLAEKHLLRAIERQTQHYTITKDTEAYYNLGVVYHFQNKYKEAADCFWKATWYPTFQSPAYFGLAQIECTKSDFYKALEYIDASLQVNARNTKAITLKAYIVRKLGKNDAINYIDNILSIDPLDYWALSEQSIIKGNGPAFLKEAEKNRGEGLIRLQELLELVVDYGNIGAYDEAIALLEEAVTLGFPYADSPLIYYYAGYYTSLKNDKRKALQYYTKGNKQLSDYCFPFRLEEIALFERVIQEDPQNDKAYYYLGNLLYFLNQKEKAIEAWKTSKKLNSGFALTQRNLGFALNREDKKEEAIDYYKKAIGNDNANPRLLVEADKIYEQIRLSAGERLALLHQHLKTVMSHDDAVIRMLMLYNEAGMYDDAIVILQKRHFHVWEGGGQVHNIFVDSHLLKGLEYMKNSEFDDAIREFETADTYPENLEVGRPSNGGQYSKIYYYIGKAYQAKKLMRKAKECFEKSAAENVSTSEKVYNELDIYRSLSYQELSNTKKSYEINEACSSYVNVMLNNNNILDEYSKFGEDGTYSERSAQLLYLKGLVYYAQKNIVNADELFKQALNLNPDLIWAKHFLNEKVIY